MVKEEKTQIKCLWSHIVGSSSVDIDSNSLSLFNLIEEITSEVQIPTGTNTDNLVIPIQYQLVCLWEKLINPTKEVREDLQIDIVSPSGKVLQTISYNLVIPEKNQRMRLRLNMNGFKVEEDGKYNFIIGVKKDNKVTPMSEVSVTLKFTKKFISPIQKK